MLVLTAAGRLGHASAGALSAALDAAIALGNRGLVIDLAQVDYLSSAGLTAIDKAAARLAGVSEILVLCAVPEPVRIALDLAGLLSHFPIESSRERAVARVASGTGPSQ